jgi:hypothetical protein
MKHWTAQHIQQLKDEGRIVDYKENGRTHGMPQNLPNTALKKRSKYNATKTTVNGLQFASMKEANYYKNVLLPRLKAGEIGLLELQKEYELNNGGTYSYKYRADFVWVEALTGETVICDVKGYATKELKKKCRLMKKVHGITIKIV